MSRKYALWTLGCKVNQYESQQLRELLESAGFVEVDEGQSPDLAVVNTCAVTSNAARKSRQLIRRAASRGPTNVLVVGCYATAEAERIRRIEGVTHVVGHGEHLADGLARLLGGSASENVSSPGTRQSPVATFDGTVGSLRISRDDRSTSASFPRPRVSFPTTSGRPTGGAPFLNTIHHRRDDVKGDGELPPIHRFAGHQRAFLKVQDGCDAACTYCIIPQLRRRVRSKPICAAVEEVRRLVACGHREVVLTGVFLGAYGRQSARRHGWGTAPSPLASLVQAIASVPGLERLRLSSLEPGDLTAELVEVMSRSEPCVPHVHLPLQSGSDRILARMNRQYRVEAFLEAVTRVERALSRPAISADILVGFPGERESDFEQTLRVAHQVGFCKIHAFPFSPRAGTPAARWQKQFVPAGVIRERMQRLGELEAELALAFRGQFVGQVERVLVESAEADGRSSPGGVDEGPGGGRSGSGSAMLRLVGRADRYFEVAFCADRDLTGQLVRVHIDRVTPARVFGTMLDGCASEPRPARSTGPPRA